MMEFSIADQTWVFVQSCVLGLSIGFIYDIFRIIRIMFKAKAILTSIMDLLFCAALMCMLFVFIISAADGILRLYIFIGAVLGAYLYFFSVSGIFLGLILRLFNLISRCFMASCKPFQWLCGRCRKIIGKRKKKI